MVKCEQAPVADVLFPDSTEMLRSQLVITIPLFLLFPVYFVAPNIASQDFPDSVTYIKQSKTCQVHSRRALDWSNPFTRPVR